MNKHLQFIGLFLIASLMQVKAQSFHLGAKIGSIGNKVVGESFENGYKLSYQLGAFAEIDFLKKIGIQPELLISQNNSTYTQGISATSTTINEVKDIKLTYLSVPILFRYNVLKVLTLNVGPQYSNLINKGSSGEENVKSAFKSGDLGLVVGAQLHLLGFRAYARYVVGITKNEIKNVTNTTTWNSQQFQIGVGKKIF